MNLVEQQNGEEFFYFLLFQLFSQFMSGPKLLHLAMNMELAIGLTG
jgi:hypothetical protein